MSLTPEVLAAVALCHPPPVPALLLPVEHQAEGAVELPPDGAAEGHGHGGWVHLILPPRLPAELTHGHQNSEAETAQENNKNTSDIHNIQRRRF